MFLFASNEASHPGYHAATAGKLVVIAAALAVLTLYFMRAALRGPTSARIIAMSDGVRCSPYPELGPIPWQAISNIHTELPFRMTYGGAMVVASLKEPAAFERLLKPSNAAAPSRPLAPPFATIATSEHVDLQMLSPVLAEYLEQEQRTKSVDWPIPGSAQQGITLGSKD